MKKALLLLLLCGATYGQNAVTRWYGCTAASAVGTDDYACSLAVAPANYAAIQGYPVCWTTDVANTTAATLALNGGSAVTIRKWSSGSLVDLATNDLGAGQRVCAIYTGTYFELQNAPGTGGGTSLYDTNPAMNGTAAAGASSSSARGDHVHPSDTSRVPTTRTVAGHALSADVTVSKSDVGLGNVDNTADTGKPVSTAQQTALDLKANLAGPALTGTPTTPTASANTNNTQIASTAYADAAALARTVFSTSTAVTSSFSATPTFSLAAVSNKSPARFEPGAMTANVTSVTFSNKVAGAKFSIAWLQDGTGGRTVAYGASVATSCAVLPTASKTTTHFLEVAADGTSVNCVNAGTDDEGAEYGPTMAAPGTPASSNLICWNDSTDNTRECKDSSGNIYKMVKSGADINNVTGAVTKVNGGSIPASAPFAGTNSSSQIVLFSPFTTNAQTATYQVLAADFSGYKTIVVASGTFTITLVASGSQPPAGQFIRVINYGSGVVTIARSGQNINGGTSSLVLPAASATAPTSALVLSDATNYFGSVMIPPNATGCTNQFVRTLNGSATPTCASVATADIAANAVDSSKQAVVNTRRVCDIVIGDTSGSALANGQLGPQKRLCYLPAAATVQEVVVSADGGTPNIIIAKNVAGTVTNLLSSALATAASGGIACSKTSAVAGIDGTTCSATLQNNTSIAAGSYIEAVSGTAGGTAKLMTIHVIWTVD